MATDETVETITPAQKRAAKRNPAGDTEHSGASAGLKAESASQDDTPDTFGPTKAEERARKEIDKEADEVREQQLAAHEAHFTSVPVGRVETAYANAPDKGEPESITFAHVGGVLLVTSSTGKPLRFGREEALGLQRAVTAIGAAL